MTAENEDVRTEENSNKSHLREIVSQRAKP